jgi:Putative Actinobacterial Holin-X, holin superfamily III
VSSVFTDAQRLVALEVALAKQEMKELAVRNAIAAAIIAAGALLLGLGLLVALPVLIVGLLGWTWIAAAVWLGIYLIAGAGAVAAGWMQLDLRMPTRTIDSLKENKEWALRRVRSNGR